MVNLTPDQKIRAIKVTFASGLWKSVCFMFPIPLAACHSFVCSSWFWMWLILVFFILSILIHFNYLRFQIIPALVDTFTKLADLGRHTSRLRGLSHLRWGQGQTSTAHLKAGKVNLLSEFPWHSDLIIDLTDKHY